MSVGSNPTLAQVIIHENVNTEFLNLAVKFRSVNVVKGVGSLLTDLLLNRPTPQSLIELCFRLHASRPIG